MYPAAKVSMDSKNVRSSNFYDTLSGEQKLLYSTYRLAVDDIKKYSKVLTGEYRSRARKRKPGKEETGIEKAREHFYSALAFFRNTGGSLDYFLKLAKFDPDEPRIKSQVATLLQEAQATLALENERTGKRTGNQAVDPCEPQAVGMAPSL